MGSKAHLLIGVRISEKGQMKGIIMAVLLHPV